MENFDFSNINFTQQKSYKKDVREIPLFIDFNKLMNVIDDIVCQLPKHVQTCYASFIINGCLKCLSKVTQAYRNPQNRKENLNAIYDDIPILEVAVKHLIDNSKIAQCNADKLNTLITQISKQINAWKSQS